MESVCANAKVVGIISSVYSKLLMSMVRYALSFLCRIIHAISSGYGMSEASVGSSSGLSGLRGSYGSLGVLSIGEAAI